MSSSEEIIDVAHRRPMSQKDKLRKPALPPRIKTLSEPRNRVYINLYDEFCNVLDPLRSARIRRKLENINKKTLEDLEHIFEEQRERIEEQRKKLKRSHPKKQDVAQRILHEFFNRFSKSAAKHIMKRRYPNPTNLSVPKQRLVNCAYLNINHVVATAAQVPGSEIEKNLQVKLACEVANFVESVLCNIKTVK